MTLSHISLKSYYEIMYILTKNYGFNLHDLEGMLPWERDIYVEQLRVDVEQEKSRK